MYNGKHFRLKQEILGIEIVNHERIAISIRTGQVLRVLSSTRPDDLGLVGVLWGDRTLMVFAEDLERRGEEIRSHSTT